MINAETSVGACGSDVWQKIRDRWSARRAERETKTHQTATWRVEGRRDDRGHELGAEGNRQGRQQEHGCEATQRRLEDALRTLSASAGSQRRSLHVLDDQTIGLQSTRNRKSNCAPSRNWRRPRAGITASVLQGWRLSRACCKRCLREAAQWERPTRLLWQTSTKCGTIWNRRVHSIWYLIASRPKCTTQL